MALTNWVRRDQGGVMETAKRWLTPRNVAIVLALLTVWQVMQWTVHQDDGGKASGASSASYVVTAEDVLNAGYSFGYTCSERAGYAYCAGLAYEGKLFGCKGPVDWSECQIAVAEGVRDGAEGLPRRRGDS